MAVELKTGKFKTAYLGQLSGYLSILDGFERRPHENPSIGIILCKDMDKSFVDYVISDYRKPMGVATYKTSKDMSEELKKSLPDLDELRRLIDVDENDWELQFFFFGPNWELAATVMLEVHFVFSDYTKWLLVTAIFLEISG